MPCVEKYVPSPEVLCLYLSLSGSLVGWSNARSGQQFLSYVGSDGLCGSPGQMFLVTPTWGNMVCLSGMPADPGAVGRKPHPPMADLGLQEEQLLSILHGKGPV
jgi:hypothetical protein